MKSIPQDARRVNSSISIPAIPHDEICAGCWNYGDSFVIEYPFDDWTPAYLLAYRDWETDRKSVV